MKLGAAAIGRIVSLAIVLGVVALNLALHARGYGRGILMEGTTRYSLRLLPDQVFTMAFSDVPTSINSAGFRGPEWGPPPTDAAGAPRRDPALLRVAVVGHSVTLGGWETPEETYCGVLERRLQDALDRAGDPRRAQVMNFAGPAYNLADMRAIFEDCAHPYRPDYLVVPVFAVDVRPQELVPPPRDFPLRGWIQRTALFDWLTEASRGPARTFTRALTAEERAERDRRVEVARAVGAAPFEPSLARLWLRASADLEALRALQASGGGRTVIAAPVEQRDLRRVAGWEYVGDRLAQWCAGREAVIHVAMLADFRAAVRPLQQEMERKGVPPDRVWSYARPPQEPPPLEHLDASPWLTFMPGHYSRLGHRLVGEALARAILADLGLAAAHD